MNGREREVEGENVVCVSISQASKKRKRISV